MSTSDTNVDRASRLEAHEDEVLTVAEEIDAVEQRIRDAVKSGLTLVDARRQYGYHSLQTRKK